MYLARILNVVAILAFFERQRAHSGHFFGEGSFESPYGVPEPRPNDKVSLGACKSLDGAENQPERCIPELPDVIREHHADVAIWIVSEDLDG